MTSPYQKIWLELGRANPWVSRAVDPPFADTSFSQCETLDELLNRFEHGNWALGSAFYLGDLCFIQQNDGGDEWLTIKQEIAFESVSFGGIIRRDGRAKAQQLIEDLQQASLAQCKSLTYRSNPLHHYTVTIPYYHRFTVVASSEEEALEKAHSEEGVIVGYEDDLAVVEIADEVFGAPGGGER